MQSQEKNHNWQRDFLSVVRDAKADGMQQGSVRMGVLDEEHDHCDGVL